MERCLARYGEKGLQIAGSESGPDPFTITIPGLSDFLRAPFINTPEIRRERAQRARSSNSPLPQGLQWIPKLLNKLDDAQDLLFTVAALAIPIARWFGVRSIPGLGIALTVNDLLNGFT